MYFCNLAATDACAQYMSSDQVDLIRIDEELGDSSLDVSRDSRIDRTVDTLEHIHVVVFHFTVLLFADAVLSSGAR